MAAKLLGVNRLPTDRAPRRRPRTVRHGGKRPGNPGVATTPGATPTRSRATRPTLGTLLVGIALLAAPASPVAAAEVTFSTSSALPHDSRQEHARYTRFRPARNQLVQLNPPRFSWPYDPQVIDPGGDYPSGRLFTLQISSQSDFATLAVEIRDTPYNFYNFLPPLEGFTSWFWRVGYDVGTTEEVWSPTRVFRIAPGARVWDRSGFPALLDRPLPRPRMFFEDGRQAEIRDLADSNSESATFLTLLENRAEATFGKPWWSPFPANDCPGGVATGGVPCFTTWGAVGQDMAAMAFSWVVTGDERYAAVQDRFLQLARFPPGGWSSPEGTNPGSFEEEPTHVTHYLGLFYDWFYDRLTPAERATVRASIEWRVDAAVDGFFWQITDPISGADRLSTWSLGIVGWSHPFEALWPTMIGALAIVDESEVAREAAELGLNYLIGVTNAFGEDEAWNEGPGYGNDKLRQALDAMIAYDVAYPEMGLSENLEIFREYQEFFARAVPAGGDHSSFGNRSHNFFDWGANRARNGRVIGRIFGDGTAWKTYLEDQAVFDAAGKTIRYDMPWIEYVVPAYYPVQPIAADLSPNRVYPVEGWATVSSAAPNDRAAQDEAVSMTFQAPPRGAYSHAFASANAFDLHAFGETLAVGGGSTDNFLEFSRNSLSHNTVLVNGVGQMRSTEGDYFEVGDPGPAQDRETPIRARLAAWSDVSGGATPVVYFAGDATDAYSEEAALERFLRHVVFVDGSWFAVYDDLGTRPANPARFQWLYHVVPAASVPMTFEPATDTFRYTMGAATVAVRHIGGADDLEFEFLRSAEGQLNIFECGLEPTRGACDEDYRFETTTNGTGRGVIDAHHIWVQTQTPETDRHFLSVIAPYREGVDQRPVIARVPGTDRAVSVTFAGKATTVSFDPAVDADIVVDTAAIARAAGRKARVSAPGALGEASLTVEGGLAATEPLRHRAGRLPDRLDGVVRGAPRIR